MEQNWKQDPRLRAMSKEKLDLLTEFASRMENTDKSRLAEALISINKEAKEKNIQFNDRETALLVTILSASMPQADRKKIDLLKMLSKKLTGMR